MGWDRLKELLGKYWDGLSDLEEEREISRLLEREDLPPSFKGEKMLFTYYSEQRSSTLGTGKSDNYIKALHAVKKPGRVISLIWTGLKVAAVITVIATAGWIIRDEMKARPESIQPLADSFEDPQKAFEETKKALMMLSRNMGKGREQASRFKAFSEAMDKARNLENDKKEEKL